MGKCSSKKSTLEKCSISITPKIATFFLESYHRINRIFHTVPFLFKVLNVSTNDILWAVHPQND